MPSPSEGQAGLLASFADVPRGSVSDAVASALAPRLPKFVYFSEYHRLPGQVQLEGLQERLAQGGRALTVSDPMFLAFLQQAGTDLADLIGAGTFEHFVARLEAVSTRITREIFEYWSQNHHLLVEFRVDPGRLKDPPPFNSGMVFRIRIKDTRHGVTLAFDERSAGFVWFFSFIVWFSQARRTYGARLVILLDEPGLSLHARAQADLLRYIDEKLKPHYGVLYTTHSAFMIDPDNVATRGRWRRSSDGERVGTKVGEAMRCAEPDRVFPLQAALGYDAIRSLFVGKSTLLVERRATCCTSRRSPTPCAPRADRPGPALGHHAHRRRGQGRRLRLPGRAQRAQDRGGRQLTGGRGERGRRPRRRAQGRGHVFAADGYAGQGEADLEDIIGREMYTKLVNRCYNLSAIQRLPEARPPALPRAWCRRWRRTSARCRGTWWISTAIFRRPSWWSTGRGLRGACPASSRRWSASRSSSPISTRCSDPRRGAAPPSAPPPEDRSAPAEPALERGYFTALGERSARCPPTEGLRLAGSARGLARARVSRSGALCPARISMPWVGERARCLLARFVLAGVAVLGFAGERGPFTG